MLRGRTCFGRDEQPRQVLGARICARLDDLRGTWRAGMDPQEILPFTRRPGQDHVVSVRHGDDLAVSMPDAHHVILTGPSGERQYLLRIHTRPPGPAQVVKAGADASTEDLPGLLIAPKASPAAQHAALRAGVS